MSKPIEEAPTPETIIKKIVIELLQRNDMVALSEDKYQPTDKLTHTSSGKSIAEHHRECYKALGINAVTPKIDPENELFLFNKVIYGWLTRATELELAKAIETPERIIERGEPTKVFKVVLTKFVITPKGLETALKLQEHDDNKERFEQQRAISETLKNNSTKSLQIAIAALTISSLMVGLGIHRVGLLEEKIVSHDAMELRILAAEEENKRLAAKLNTMTLLVKDKQTERQ